MLDLNRHYRRSVSGKKFLIYSFICGGFVAVFLIIFQPFGLYKFDHEDKYWLISGFGAVSTVILLIYYMVLKSILKKTRWTLGKQALSLFSITFLIGIGNGAYAFIIDLKEFSPENVLWFLWVTFAVGIFPVAGLLISDYFKKISILVSKEDKDDSRILRLEAENKKDVIDIPLNELLYIQSSDNYCEIVTYNSELQKTLIRNSIKQLNEQITYEEVVKCHRSYIVNLSNIAKCEGNAQGMKISFHSSNDFVSVSRKFVPEIRRLLSLNSKHLRKEI